MSETNFKILNTRMTREKSGHTRREVLCRCACGNEQWRSAQHVKTGRSTQCKSCAGKTHGASDTREYKAWYAMIHRCTNPANQWYARYGGRGIKVCDRWKLFENFLADMGACPPQLTLERCDNDAGYSQDNCYWATRKEQNGNRSGNVYVTAFGKRQTASDWARERAMQVAALLYRLHHGWDAERALTTKVSHANR